MMLIHRLKPAKETWFAWRPVWTSDGLVWLEHVRFWHKTIATGGYIYERLPSYMVHDGATTEYTTLPQDKGVTLGDNWKPQYRGPFHGAQ